VARVLVVEDDPEIAEPLALTLRREGYEVVTADHGRPALDMMRLGEPIDLVLLDLNLPDLDGLAVCRELRQLGNAVPVIMLTARTDELDQVIGFESGADDYVTKPFSAAALLARVRVRLRGVPLSSRVLEVSGVTLDLDAHRAWCGGDEVQLSRKEFDLLALLMGEAGKVVERSRIMREVWDEHWYGPTRTLDMHVMSLRRKLGDDRAMLISTVRGVGFRFERV
jgi:DNA-binding response OmpR family regulator